METFNQAFKAIRGVATTGIDAIRQVANEDGHLEILDHVTGKSSSESDKAAKRGREDHDSTKISESRSGSATEGESASKSVPTNIKTFRTIIHFLSQLGVKQQASKSEPNPKPSWAV